MTGAVDFHFPPGTRLTIIDVQPRAHAAAGHAVSADPRDCGRELSHAATSPRSASGLWITASPSAKRIGRLVVPAEQASGVAVMFEE